MTGQYEVRSDDGLEGVFGSDESAQGYAAELRCLGTRAWVELTDPPVSGDNHSPPSAGG